MHPFILDIAQEHQRELRRQGIRSSDTLFLRRRTASTLRRMACVIDPD